MCGKGVFVVCKVHPGIGSRTAATYPVPPRAKKRARKAKQKGGGVESRCQESREREDWWALGFCGTSQRLSRRANSGPWADKATDSLSR